MSDSDYSEVDGFVPMRLILQPSGLTIICGRSQMVVGRHTSADIRLPLPDVSRQHCRLLFTPDGWKVQDLDSLNGIYVNESAVASAELRPGDKLRVGGFTFEVELPENFERADVEEPHESSVLRSIAESLPPAA